MSNIKFFALLLLLLGHPEFLAAQVRVAMETELIEYHKAIRRADVVLLDGAVKVAKKSGYQTKWNSVELIPSKNRTDYYGSKFTKGGRNTSDAELSVVALVPLYEYRGKEKPELEITSLSVNGQDADAYIILPRKNVADAIRKAKEAFPGEELFESQLHPSVPILFVNAGIVEANSKIVINYETKPRRPLKVRRKIR